MTPISPERLAWELLDEAEEMHFVLSNARDRAFVGRWTRPITIGDFLFWLEEEADIHETDALEFPDEAGRHDAYALRLRELIGRLRDLGCRPTPPVRLDTLNQSTSISGEDICDPSRI